MLSFTSVFASLSGADAAAASEASSGRFLLVLAVLVEGVETVFGAWGVVAGGDFGSDVALKGEPPIDLGMRGLRGDTGDELAPQLGQGHPRASEAILPPVQLTPLCTPRIDWIPSSMA